MCDRDLKLRWAAVSDCACIWEWSNDPITRQASLHPEPIAWKNHEVWFLSKLASPQTRYYIALDQDQPIGEIRFDLEGQEAVVSITLASAYRGQGYAATLIRLGVDQLMAETEIAVIQAFIKPTSIASIRAFQKAGFQEHGATILQKQLVLRFVRERITNLDTVDR